MSKSWMIADYLRPYARWRVDRAGARDDEGADRDGGHDARAAIGLIDAAAYAMRLDDDADPVARLDAAGCFAGGRFDPGPEGERIVRNWHCDTAGGPADLMEALASAAERARRTLAAPAARA
ncbi:hypothetical protein [Actinomadura parmotrematis]|uniref:Uncharacterized protein n=1 Tax=Actinomadura parmotrematis TaxID=2864039 RepID=A0ABS7FX54_9ACTN|nr:hypothetical protein [Actinomadura parmotrematis]MBW8484906.1 hypothetical protein [Actinomadura parmotrematis]